MLRAAFLTLGKPDKLERSNGKKNGPKTLPFVIDLFEEFVLHILIKNFLSVRRDRSIKNIDFGIIDLIF